MVLKAKPFYARDAYEGAKNNKRAGEDDAEPDDSDKNAGGEMLIHALRLGLRLRGGTGHSKWIWLDDSDESAGEETIYSHSGSILPSKRSLYDLAMLSQFIA